MYESHETLGALGALLSSVTWAYGANVYSHLSHRYDSYRIHFSRALIALPFFLLGVVFFERGSLPEINFERFLWLSGSILSSYAMGDIFFLLSAQAMGLSGALALSSIYPIWSSFAGVFFQGQSLNALQWVGVFAVVAGVFGVIILGNKSAKSEGVRHPAYFKGIVLSIVTSLFWASNTFCLARGALPGAPLLTNAIRMGAALFYCPLIGVLIFRSSIRNPLLDKVDFIGSGKAIWFESFMGSLLFVFGLSYAKLAVASALSSMAPVIAYVIACFMGREKLSFLRFLALAVVTGGVILLIR